MLLGNPSTSRRVAPRTAARAATALVALSVLVVSAPSVAEAAAPSLSPLTPQLRQQIQQLVDTYKPEDHFPGIAVAVVTPNARGTRPDTTYFFRGNPTVGAAAPVTRFTQFEIGSETKEFTGALLAYLISTGRVSLDDPVQKFAPAGITVPVWRENGVATPITLRNLATHQAALPDTPLNFPTTENPWASYTETMMWQGLADTQLLWQPGTNWLYSNFAYGILGTILAGVLFPGAQPPAYEKALDAAFLADLRMHRTQLGGTSHRLATPYDSDGNVTSYINDTNALAGSGGLTSDITDMGTWVATNLGWYADRARGGARSVPNTLQPISSPAIICQSPTDCAANNTGLQMGMVWELHPADTSGIGVPWVFKNGATGGFQSSTLLAPTMRTGVTVLTNGGLSSPTSPYIEPLGNEIFKLLVPTA